MSFLQISIIDTEYIDCNTYDDTGILGPHPYHTNLIFATGFGRQGINSKLLINNMLYIKIFCL